MLHVVLLAATLFGGLGHGLTWRQGYKYPFLDVIDLTTNKSAIPLLDGIPPLDGLGGGSLRPRDEDVSDTYSFLFNEGSTCEGTNVYGSFGKVDRSQGCVNLPFEGNDKEWNSLQFGLGSGYDLFLFAGAECCTGGSIQPCSTFIGDDSSVYAVDNECQRSAGPPGQTGLWFARSALISPHSLPEFREDGPQPREVCAVPEGGHACTLCSDSFHSKQDAGCQKPNDGYSFKTDRSGNTTNFGNQNPADIVRQMADRCGDTGCNGVEFTIDNVAYDTAGASNTDDTGYGKEGGKLMVTMGGLWEPGQKQNFVDALTLLGANSTAMYKTLVTYRPQNPTQGSDSVEGTFYSAMDGVRISRKYTDYNGHSSVESYAQVKVTFIPDKEDTCEYVTSLVTNFAGAVSGIAGGFFGEFGDVICDALG